MIQKECIFNWLNYNLKYAASPFQQHIIRQSWASDVWEIGTQREHRDLKINLKKKVEISSHSCDYI